MCLFDTQKKRLTAAKLKQGADLTKALVKKAQQEKIAAVNLIKKQLEAEKDNVAALQKAMGQAMRKVRGAWFLAKLKLESNILVRARSAWQHAGKHTNKNMKIHTTKTSACACN